MKHLDPISHVMTTNVKTVQISQKMSEVLRILAENQIHHVPVVDGRRLSGMISTTDIIRLNITVSTADEWSIEEVMKRNLVTIDINDSVRKAAQLLSDGIFHSLPVINNERHLVGIITSTDLIRYLVKLLNCNPHFGSGRPVSGNALSAQVSKKPYPEPPSRLARLS